MTAYWIERFPPRVFGPAAAVIAVAGQPFATFDPRQWAGATLTALLLLAQFRLWDDLADRERDRQTAPERVLVRVSSIGPFVAVCVALALINLLLAALSGGVTGVAGCLLLNAAAAAWYAWRPARCTVAADLVLLVKYPWFVIVIAAGSGAPFAQIAVAAVVIYAAACAFEYLSCVASGFPPSPRLRRTRRSFMRRLGSRKAA